MTEKVYKTRSGDIHYWIELIDNDAVTPVFLPGLTADHRLFEKQIEYFKGKYNIFVWNAPAHAASWPFKLDFDIMGMAQWLKEILDEEKVTKPVIIGQSIGAHVGQSFAELYPDKLKGFVSVNSTPLQKKHFKSAELWLLKILSRLVRFFPWKSLLKSAPKGIAESEYGRNLMYEMMMVYDGDRKRYSALMAYGLKLIAAAVEKDLPYSINCPALLIYGENDTLVPDKLARAWHESSGIPLEVIKGAGHNSNADQPKIVNDLIEKFVTSLLR